MSKKGTRMGESQTSDRRKAPRMLGTRDEEETNKRQGAAVNHDTTPETIEITLKGGVEAKLFLNRLRHREKYRWQTGSFIDVTKASGSRGNPQVQTV